MCREGVFGRACKRSRMAPAGYRLDFDHAAPVIGGDPGSRGGSASSLVQSDLSAFAQPGPLAFGILGMAWFSSGLSIPGKRRPLPARPRLKNRLTGRSQASVDFARMPFADYSGKDGANLWITLGTMIDWCSAVSVSVCFSKFHRRARLFSSFRVNQRYGPSSAIALQRNSDLC